MKQIYLKIARFTIEVTLKQTAGFHYVEEEFIKRLQQYYSRFIIDEGAKRVDFKIGVVYQTSLDSYSPHNQQDFYINLFKKTGRNKILTYYSISDEQFYLVIRTALQQLLSANQGFFMHGSASRINNQANIFLGTSGAGKSTIMTLLSKQFSPLADDSFIIRKEKNSFYFYSTPIWEKNAWFQKDKEKIAVGNIFFLKKSKNHQIVKITQQKATGYLFKQIFSDPKNIAVQAQTIIELIDKTTNFYRLEFSLLKQNNLIAILKEANEKNKIPA